MSWFIFFLIFPQFKPASLAYLWPTLDMLFDGARLLSALMILFLFLLKKKIPSKPVWVLATLGMWLVFTTYLNDGDLRIAFLTMASILSVALIIDFFASNISKLINSLMLNVEWLLYANLISVLLTFPTGMYVRSNALAQGGCYFLGYHNSFFEYSLIGICLAMIYIYIQRRYLRAICLIAVSYLPILITWSATSVTALVGITILMLLPQKIAEKITYTKVLAVTATANLAITVFRVMDRVMWVAWYIETILHKKVTLTGRTSIWDQCYKLIQAHPWFGLGVGNHIAMYGKLASSHNEYFQLLIEGGIIALLLFIVFNLIVGKKLMQSRRKVVGRVFVATIMGLYIIFIAESYQTPPIYVIFILAYHIDKFPEVPAMFSERLKEENHVQNRKIHSKY